MNKNYDFTDFKEFVGKICFILAIMIVLKSLFDDLVFRTRFNSPYPKTTTSAPINYLENPTQNWQPNLYGSIKIKSIDNKKEYIIIKNAEYSISGLLVTKNTNFWFRGINRSEFDGIALVDVGIMWGELAKKDIITKNFEFKSKKTLDNARMLYARVKSNSQYTYNDLRGQYSHTHIVPATPNVMAAILEAKKYKKIKLDGYLIDIVLPNGKIAYTSDSRTDTDGSSRGMHIENAGSGGSCEIMYVTSVQLDNKIYK